MKTLTAAAYQKIDILVNILARARAREPHTRKGTRYGALSWVISIHVQFLLLSGLRADGGTRATRPGRTQRLHTTDYRAAEPRLGPQAQAWDENADSRTRGAGRPILRMTPSPRPRTIIYSHLVRRRPSLGRERDPLLGLRDEVGHGLVEDVLLVG